MKSALLLCFFSGLGLFGQADRPRNAGPAGSDRVGPLIQAAAAAQQHGDLKAAIEGYRKVLELQPSMIPVRVQLASALMSAGQMDAAIAEDAEILKGDPGNLAAQMNAATAYYRRGDVNRARYIFEMIHKAHPANVSAAMGLAYVYIALHRDEDAAQLLQPLDSANAKNLDFEYVYGFALVRSGKLGDGVPKMESVARERRSADAWMIAATALFQDRKFAQARDDAEHAIAVNPSFPGAQTLAGQSRYALSDVDGATPEFQAALRQNPRDFTANLYLGIIRSDQRDFATARPLLELAVELVPDHPLARLELARLNSKTGHLDEAVKTLEALEKQTPDWLDPHVLLSTLYYIENRPADGQRERRIVAELQAKQQKAGPRQPN